MEKYIFHLLTWLTVIFHLLFILFVIAGGLFIRKNKWVLFVHLGSVLWAVYAEISPGVICPITSLENYFANHAGLSTYKDDFVTRYLVPVIYQEDIAPHIQLILVGIVICINLVIYGFALRKTSCRQTTK